MSDLLAGRELSVLSEFWMSEYLANRDQAPPFVSLVGSQSDAIASADSYGDTVIENLAFLTGYLAYPCDAVYVTVTMPVVGELEGRLAGKREAVVAWSHCIATDETVATMRVCHLEDDGIEYWESVECDPDDQGFMPLRYAAHDFDEFDIEEDEARMRKVAMDLIEQNNGTGYVMTRRPAGESLVKAIEHAVNGGDFGEDVN